MIQTNTVRDFCHCSNSFLLNYIINTGRETSFSIINISSCFAIASQIYFAIISTVEAFSLLHAPRFHRMIRNSPSLFDLMFHFRKISIRFNRGCNSFFIIQRNDRQIRNNHLRSRLEVKKICRYLKITCTFIKCYGIVHHIGLS